jgi:glycosyltransferase involved in cell wall biosynthesis
MTSAMLSEFCDLNNIPNDSRLKILMVVAPNSGGVGYYRIHQPAKYLNKILGDRVIALDTEVVTPELIYGWADVIVLSRVSHPEFFMFARRTKAATVYEIDDLVHGIPDSNLASRDWGADGYRYWWSKEILGACKAVQCSTEELLRIYDGDIVLPNLVDPDLFPTSAGTHSEVRIGWQGSATHFADVQMFREALLEVQSKYGETVKFIFMGWNGRYTSERTGEKADALQGLLRKSYGWRPIHDGQYYRDLAGLSLDISLCPLEDTAFNRCKSNIKSLEYGVCSYAVVASPVTPYLWMRHGRNAMFANSVLEWQINLKLLIDNEPIRTELGANLRCDVLRDFDIKNRIHEYYDFYKSL